MIILGSREAIEGRELKGAPRALPPPPRLSSLQNSPVFLGLKGRGSNFGFANVFYYFSQSVTNCNACLAHAFYSHHTCSASTASILIILFIFIYTKAYISMASFPSCRLHERFLVLHIALVNPKMLRYSTSYYVFQIYNIYLKSLYSTN